MKRNFAALACGVAVLGLLEGCAPTTAGGVRALGSQREFSFVSSENYQTVYRKVLTQERKCWESGLITAEMVVHGDLYTDIKQGVVTVELHSGMGIDIYQVVDISSTKDQETSISAHYTFGSVQQYGGILKQWVLNNYTECS